MFRPEPLQHVQLVLLASEAQDGALELARFGEFHPVHCAEEALGGAAMEQYRDAWQLADSRLQKLLAFCGDSGALHSDAVLRAPSFADLQELNHWLRVSWAECLDHLEQSRISEQERQHLAALDETLSRIESLNVDLAELLRPTGLLSVRLGTLPVSAVARLQDALGLSAFLLTVFGEDAEQAYAVIAGPRQREDEIRALLLQAGWHELQIPPELQRHPQAARHWLEQRAEQLAAQQAEQTRLSQLLCAELKEGVQEARQRLALAQPLVTVATQGVCGNQHLLVLAGWVPQARLAALRALLDSSLQGRYWMEVRDPAPTEKLRIPSLVRYPAWLKPFVPVVRGYGVVRYGEFDPVLPFGLLYLLLFGAMFGDIGHGAVIALVSFLLIKRFGSLLWIGVAAGVVSILFGVLYGSIFGYEELFPPLWLSPLHEPLQVLLIAVLLGVGFIALTILIAVRNAWAEGKYAQALFDADGIAGLCFYLGTVAGLLALADVFALGTHADTAWMLAGLGLAAVALYKWMEVKSGIAERVLVTLIETVETGINLFSNTLSFMRVAAFSLNHVALALAVFTLAASMGAFGHWVILVLGNIIIIVLEGAIVAIQALRLVYYEGFSRFFHGDGEQFSPVSLPDVSCPVPVAAASAQTTFDTRLQTEGEKT